MLNRYSLNSMFYSLMSVINIVLLVYLILTNFGHELVALMAAVFFVIIHIVVEFYELTEI
jgi:hypothetical protein